MVVIEDRCENNVVAVLAEFIAKQDGRIVFAGSNNRLVFGRDCTWHPKVVCYGMAYDAELSGCFGEDLVLAARPCDRDCAFAWLVKLRERKATWADASTQIEEYLRAQDAPVFHILDQIERAGHLFRTWLHDPVDEGQAGAAHPKRPAVQAGSSGTMVIWPGAWPSARRESGSSSP